MPYATQVTIIFGSTESATGQPAGVSVSLTYNLECNNTDVLEVVRHLAVAGATAHRLASQGIGAEAMQPSSGSTSIPDTGNGSSPSGNTPSGGSETGAVLPEDEPATEGQIMTLRALLSYIGMSSEEVQERLRTDFSCSSLEELSQRQVSGWLLQVQRSERQRVLDQKKRVASLNGV